MSQRALWNASRLFFIASRKAVSGQITQNSYSKPLQRLGLLKVISMCPTCKYARLLFYEVAGAFEASVEE